MFEVGDRVRATREIGKQRRNRLKLKKYSGTIIQVCKRFVVVDVGFFREAFWLEDVVKL